MNTTCIARVPERFTRRGTPWADSWGEDWGRVVEAEETKRGQRICGARTIAGPPCTAVSEHPSGRCRYHGGVASTGAPGGNRNALRHGLFARSIQRCGPHCPLWKHCPMAGPDVEAMAEAERPECPYEVAHFETAVRDGLERFGMLSHPAPESLSEDDTVRPQEAAGEGLRRNMVCTIAMLQVMMLRATSSLSVRPLVRGSGKRADRIKIDPALEAFQRVSAEQRRYLGCIRDPSGLTKWDERYPEVAPWRPEWQVRWEEAARAAAVEKNHGEEAGEHGEGEGRPQIAQMDADGAAVQSTGREVGHGDTGEQRGDEQAQGNRGAGGGEILAMEITEGTEGSGHDQEQGKHGGAGNGEILTAENTKNTENTEGNGSEQEPLTHGEHEEEREQGENHGEIADGTKTLRPPEWSAVADLEAGHNEHEQETEVPEGRSGDRAGDGVANNEQGRVVLGGDDARGNEQESDSRKYDEDQMPECEVPPLDPAYEEIPPGAEGYQEGVIRFRRRRPPAPTDHPVWPKDREEEKRWRGLRRRVREAREAVAMAEAVNQGSRISVPSRMLLEQLDRAREVVEKLELEAVETGVPLPVRHYPVRLGWNPDG